MKIKKANGGFVVNNGKRKGVNVMTPSELKTLRVIDPASNKIGIKANSLKITIFFPWKNLLQPQNNILHFSCYSSFNLIIKSSNNNFKLALRST